MNDRRDESMSFSRMTGRETYSQANIKLKKSAFRTGGILKWQII